MRSGILPVAKCYERRETTEQFRQSLPGRPPSHELGEPRQTLRAMSQIWLFRHKCSDERLRDMLLINLRLPLFLSLLSILTEAQIFPLGSGNQDHSPDR